MLLGNLDDEANARLEIRPRVRERGAAEGDHWDHDNNKVKVHASIVRSAHKTAPDVPGLWFVQKRRDQLVASAKRLPIVSQSTTFQKASM